jgi:hypothetical protein
MHVSINPHKIQVSNGMAQLYQCFIKNFAFILVPIYKANVEDKTLLGESTLL